MSQLRSQLVDDVLSECMYNILYISHSYAYRPVMNFFTAQQVVYFLKERKRQLQLFYMFAPPTISIQSPQLSPSLCLGAFCVMCFDSQNYKPFLAYHSFNFPVFVVLKDMINNFPALQNGVEGINPHCTHYLIISHSDVRQPPKESRA